MDVTLDTISQVEFRERFRGYDPDQVDDFLERAGESIASHLRGRGESVSDGVLTAKEVASATFAKRFRGYEPEDVDRFLARVARQLTALERSDDLSS